MYFWLVVIILFVSSGAYLLHKRRMDLASKNGSTLLSLPSYYGWCGFLWTAIPAFAVFLILFTKGLEPSSWTHLVILFFVITCSFLLSWKWLHPLFAARIHLEKWGKVIFILCTTLAVSVTFLILLSVIFESIAFFRLVSPIEFLFTTHWSPQTALRADQAGSEGAFGAIPVFVGTLLITCIAMLVAGPLGLLSAIYISEYATDKVRTSIKPILEILAGIPTVVYGYFAITTVAPILKQLGANIGLDIAAESALAAGLVMGIMIIPFILSLSEDVMRAVPQNLRDASLAMGATMSETIKKVVLPAALPGIMSAFLLAISRAIGETMIVVMAAGLIAKMTFNPFEAVTTVTAQMVTLLVGDQEFDSAKTLAAFALGLSLFVITFVLNIISMVIVKKYREVYE